MSGRYRLSVRKSLPDVSRDDKNDLLTEESSIIDVSSDDVSELEDTSIMDFSSDCGPEISIPDNSEQNAMQSTEMIIESCDSSTSVDEVQKDKHPPDVAENVEFSGPELPVANASTNELPDENDSIVEANGHPVHSRFEQVESSKMKKTRKPLFDWKSKRKEAIDKRKSRGKRRRKSEETNEEYEENVKHGVVDNESIIGILTREPLGKRMNIKKFRHVKIQMEREKEEEEAKEPVVHEVLQISGVTVKFPVKPYPSQIAVMSKLIQGCKKKEHCLLESPTGSGKTLALLCGVLAWQEHEQEESLSQHLESTKQLIGQKNNDIEECSVIEDSGPADIEGGSNTAECGSAKAGEAGKSACCAENKGIDSVEISDDEDSCQPEPKKFSTSLSPAKACGTSGIDSKVNEPETDTTLPKRKKVPTIFYGSRTHKQIEQVIRELKKTAYADKKMTVLSSRQLTCIQDTQQNKTELCNRLLDPTQPGGCRYYNENSRKKISTNEDLNKLGISGPWDIEDLVKLGRAVGSCPYYAAKDLMAEANIVFCPYNYLVSPGIREAMQINLGGQIVILDEAHNIEDLSREMGSLNFREDQIDDVEKECERLTFNAQEDRETYRVIRDYAKDFSLFVKAINLEVIDTYNDTASSKRWTGDELWEVLNIHSLGGNRVHTFIAASGAAVADFNAAKDEIAKRPQSMNEPVSVITQGTKVFLENMTTGLSMISSPKFATHYRACVIESPVRFDTENTRMGKWLSASKKLRSLDLSCMNPAVIFAPLAELTRSIILASGTLSPISSFQSELGTVFTHKLDANHVVPKENVYIRCIPRGPTGIHLKANFANVTSWKFQDELGRLILEVCKVIPHGVLCFFSSYGMMQKQIDRWKQSDLWTELEKTKDLFQEPRGTANIDQVMLDYRESIQITADGPQNGITGALICAVYRGKIAEGIDFSDNEARCVMAVGIPYAVRKDPSVDMKFCYNDLHHSKGLLKGGEWYTIQAFRALNQALGRCLRHRNDWGAVLLIDERLMDGYNFKYLPKWVKSMWRSSTYSHLTQELEEFVSRHVNPAITEDTK